MARKKHPPIEVLREKALDVVMKFLTPKEKVFVNAYAQTKNGAEAFRIAYNPNYMDKQYHSRQGVIVRSRPIVSLVLEKMDTQLIITKASLMDELAEEIFIKEHTSVTERSMKLKAIEIAAKMSNFFEKDVTKSSSSGIQIIMKKDGRRANPYTTKNDLIEQLKDEAQESLDNIGTEQEITEGEADEQRTDEEQAPGI